MNIVIMMIMSIKGIKNIRDLFKTSINKDHYKPKLLIVVIIIIRLNMKIEEIKYYQFENI